MLRVLALLPLLLPPPAAAEEPSAQDVSLGVVSAALCGPLGRAGGATGARTPGSGGGWG